MDKEKFKESMVTVIWITFQLNFQNRPGNLGSLTILKWKQRLRRTDVTKSCDKLSLRHDNSSSIRNKVGSHKS